MVSLANKFCLVSAAFFLAWKLFMAKLTASTPHKGWRRILGDNAFKFISRSVNMRQFQYCLGTTCNTYETWAKQNSLPVLVEEIGKDARLLWIGARQTDRVVLYFHGIFLSQYLSGLF